MSRPKPKILMAYSDRTTYKSEQILKADAIYAVFLDGRPINVKQVNMLVDYPGPKYKKCSFSNAGHAFNLCTKLNEMFKTDRFQVYRLTQGEPVTEEQFLSKD